MPYFDALVAHDLLEPFTLEVTLDDGSVNSLVGFHIIDEAKLRALDPAAVGKLHEDGHLMPIFMALASLSQLRPLVDRKNRSINLSIKAKDNAEEGEAMRQMSDTQGANTGTTNLGALLKAKLSDTKSNG